MALENLRSQVLREKINRGDLSAVVGILENGHINLEERDDTGKTFLMIACQCGELNIVRELMEAGMDPNAVDNDNWNALLYAAKEGHLEIVIELLDRGANLEHKDMCGWTALMWACYKGREHVVHELLDRGANPNVKAEISMTCLAWAAGRGYTEIVKALLQKGAKVNVTDKFLFTDYPMSTYLLGRYHTEYGIVIDEVPPPNEHENGIWWISGNHQNHHSQTWGYCLCRIFPKNLLYGTTPLIWACRKGALEIVKLLLKEGASVDVTGMNSLTALLVATKGGFTEVVQALLEQDNNVNATDKDGLTSLCIAAKEGFAEIVQDLLAKDAYVNVADKAGDTILIHAVKSGYVDVVRALLNKYADVNVEGTEGKTALYWAVEKNHIDIVKLLLDSDPDLEICTKDGDTPLLRAVRSRNELCVRLFLDKGARVSAVDKKGDTALHISLRARSKRITELLLRNPRNSRLLYKPNRAGETPYSIDAFHQNQILAQIHGHRKLNANDGENLLGYDIYSSALADILSEPTLNTPITVGLYAKWGSGKSFLLGKLQSEMKSFTQMNTEDQFSFTCVLFIFLLFLNCLIGFTLALSVSWELGLSLGLGLFVFQYGFLGLVWVCSQRYDVRIAIRLSQAINRKLLLLTLLLKVLFTNPTGRGCHNLSSVPTVKFLFSESTKLTSVGGEKAIAAMVASLGEAVEEEFGFLVSRLFPVFKPNLEKMHSGRFKMLCCVPSFIIVIVVILCIMTGITLFVKYNDIDVSGDSENLLNDNSTLIKASTPYNNMALNVTMVTLACIVGLSVLTHIYTWGQAILALMVSQKKRVMKAAEQIDVLKMDGFMQKLKAEVNLMNNMVTCLDEFTKNTTRLVVVVDGLDSCEQEKIVQVLDIIQALHNEERSPFITILAVDPQVIIKGIDHNLKAAFHDTSVNGFDYLRNIVHLPFYLQSQGIRVQKEDITKSMSMYETSGGQSHGLENSPMRSYKHQDSTVSAISGFSLPESFSKKSYRKRKTRLDSITAPTSQFDLSHALTKNDYFSDINPKSVRRLMNIVAVTGRLLRAYNIEFNWYRLASWINVVEQWPYRVSWIILFFEENDNLDSSTTLKEIYNKIAEKIPLSKEIEPLLEIDRNARKLEAFLSSKSGNLPLLNIGDLKKFLPCTINLDPYLRKQIRELQHSSNILPTDLSLGHHPMYPGSSVPGSMANPNHVTNARDTDQGFLRRGNIRSPVVKQPMTGPMYHPNMMPYGPIGVHPQFMPYMMGMAPMVQEMGMGQQPPQPPTRQSNPAQFLRDYQPMCLYKLSKEEVCDLLNKIEGISLSQLSVYQQRVCENNITGLVLANCDISELGKVMEMKFGDWQLFRSAIEALREVEEINIDQDQPLLSPSYNGSVSRHGSVSKGKSAPVQVNQSNISITDFDSDPQSPRQALFNNVSRQVSSELSKSNYTLNDFMEGGSKFDHIPEEEEEEAEAELSVVNHLDLKRNNSVVAQLQYEAGLLHEAMQNFAEPVQEDEQEQEEEDPSTETFGFPVQFNLTRSNELDSSETDSSNSAIKLQQQNQEDENSRHIAELESFKSVTDGTQAESEGMLKKSPDQPKSFSENEIFKVQTYEYDKGDVGELNSVDTNYISQLPPGFLRLDSVDTQSVSSVGFATGEMSPNSQLSNSLNDSLDIVTETRDTQELSHHYSIEEGIHIYGASESGKRLKRPRSKRNKSEELPLLENSGKYFVTSNSRKPGDPESFV